MRSSLHSPFAILKIAINGDCNDDFTCELKALYEAVFFYSDLSSDFMLVPHTSITVIYGWKNQHMQKDLKGRSERSETILEAEDPGDEVDPCFDVFLTVFARISKRGCQTFFIRSNTTRTEMTRIGWTENNNKNKTYFSLHWFVILFFVEVFIQ